MTTQEAYEIVLDLATENMIDKRDNPQEYKRQAKAIDMILAEKQFAESR